MGDPSSSYATAGIVLRVSGTLKPHHHDKVETPLMGSVFLLFSLKSHQESTWRYQWYWGTDASDYQAQCMMSWSELWKKVIGSVVRIGIGPTGPKRWRRRRRRRRRRIKHRKEHSGVIHVSLPHILYETFLSEPKYVVKTMKVWCVHTAYSGDRIK
jgi:hypothetical protein